MENFSFRDKQKKTPPGFPSGAFNQTPLTKPSILAFAEFLRRGLAGLPGTENYQSLIYLFNNGIGLKVLKNEFIFIFEVNINYRVFVNFSRQYLFGEFI